MKLANITEVIYENYLFTCVESFYLPEKKLFQNTHQAGG